MDALAIGLIVAAIVFAGGMAGLHLHRVLPEAHLSQGTQDVVRLGTGMLSVLASLVLGLMIATVKTSFDATDNAMRAYAANLVTLDETLRDYGEAALPARRLVRDYTQRLLHDNWPVQGGRPFVSEDRQAGDILEREREAVRALTPVDTGQSWLKEQALQGSTALLRQRWMMIEHAGPSVRPTVIVILTAWIVAIFASFGLNAPRNATVAAALLVCSLAIGSSIFLVLELDSPFYGLMRLSSRPMRTALSHMLPPEQAGATALGRPAPGGGEAE